MRTFYRICAAAVAVVVCFASWTSVSAQPSFEFGVKGGLGFAKLSGDETSDTEFFYWDLGGGYYAEGEVIIDFGDMKLGFVGGAYAALQIVDQFGVRLEALYFKKGGKGDNSGQVGLYDPADNLLESIDVSGENTVTLDYFEFPILGVISFPVGTQARFDIFAGPALAFKTSAEAEIELTLTADGQSETEKETMDISDDVKGTDFGGIIGAGLTFDLQQVTLFFDARWEYGFTEIFEHPDDPELKNSAFSFIAGMGIPLAKSP
ncbi:MAG: PorT family protein [Candidatus Latescibacterota bacterium]|nr:MAG: PorT family protein [Candidatus Latescibacterota bacterium]